MIHTRRDFLSLASTVMATSTTMPAFLQRTALAAAGREPTSDRVLVVLQLTGGNDGLNTVVPFTDPIYREARPTLHLADAELHKLDDRLGLHPALGDLKRLYDEGQAAVVQSVGYPNPNRSHFESMAIWHTAPSDDQLQHGRAVGGSSGWIARAIDERATAAEQAASIQSLRIGSGEMPQALLGCRVQVPSLMDLAQLKQGTGRLDPRQVQEQIAAWQAGEDSGKNPLLKAAVQSTLAVHTTAKQIEAVEPAIARNAEYPSGDLAQQLRLIAQLIRAGFSTPIYYTEFGNFDTHGRQLTAHANLLGQVGRALAAFIDDVTAHVPNRPVLVLIFSEFGRRLAENASLGTDHGTAAPVFFVGSGLRAGIHGPYPDLDTLVDDDPVHAVDFRQVYATVLESWLGLNSQAILGREFDALDVLRPLRDRSER